MFFKFKKLVSVILVLIITCSLFSLSASAAIVNDGFVLNFDSSSKYLIVTGYNGSNKNPIIPSQIADFEVKKISEGAFRNNSVIESISIPITIDTIDNYAFYNCTSLKSIAVPNTVTSMGEHVFSGCTSLKNVVMNASVEELPSCTFYDCFSLTDVKLNIFLESIGNRAFQNCTSLKNLPNGFSVNSVGDFAFYNSGLQNINLFPSLETIGTKAFLNCSQLQEVIIPENVTEIAANAFAGCSDNLVIKGYTDYVKQYCAENNLTYKSAIPFYGNVNGDKGISSNDVTYIQKSIVQVEGFEIENGTEQFKAADVDGDGRITVHDAMLIQKYIVHEIDTFPVESV